MKFPHIISSVAYILVIIGALNWALVGMFGFDVVARLFGAGTMMTKVVYILIGLGAIILLITCKGMLKSECKKE